MDSKNISSSSLGDGNYGEYISQHGQSAQNAITAFLAKLWALVNDPSCDDLIAWDPSGGSFHVYDQSRFSREILPRYFKHNNFASFIRQLNMYGFRKMSTIEHGSLKNERDDIEFAHPHFIRGQDSLLELIKRRAPDNQQKPNIQGGSNTSSALVSANYLDSKSVRPIELIHLLEDVRNLQSKQTSLNDKLSYMQTENEALWGEIGSLRQKHSKQQQIVSKLMEFLLHFVTTNSTHSHEQSVEQQSSNEALRTDLHHHQQQAQTKHHSNNSPLILSEQVLSPNTLKRKQAAIMHNEEPNKRPNIQQQQQQQHFSHPPNIGRQQSVTINELSDNDTGGWLHTTNASPLVDLVPSPPPSAQNTDDNYQQQTDYRWPSSTNELLTPSVHDQTIFTQPNQTFQTVGNGNNVTNTYVPDFFLRTDNNSGTNTNIGQVDGPNLTGIKTSHVSPLHQIPIGSLLKEEQIEFPNTFQPIPHQQVDDLKPSPTLNSALYSDKQHRHKLGESIEPPSFSLDDITGDVDHIQSSLDNIRDLIFDNLPDGTSIDDLFGEDHALLSPLLQAVVNNDQSVNLLLENMQEQKPIINDNNIYTLTADNKPEQQPNQIILDPTTTSQSLPNVNNQILEQLITEATKVEEQRNTINQLERQNNDLEDKIHLLEQQQTTKRN